MTGRAYQFPRRKQMRLRGFDYSKEGFYFVTTDCNHMECHFGKIQRGKMILSDFGKIAYDEWLKLPSRFENVQLHVFQIMPNHMHGIIVITDGRGTAGNPNELDGELSRRAPTREGFQKPVKGSVPTIIRSYKSAVAYRINLMRRMQGVPVWQRNYWEHIIRNERDLQHKTNYIESNPILWDDNDENPINIKSRSQLGIG
jgi:putative transposase